jgi:16S rRNA (guanine966-N2)-methyltransferase
MRIVAGALRGRGIVAPKGQSTRPTADRTRQAVFNILEHAAWAPALHGAQVVDLFAGSGALGLEALSRGAAGCLFIDSAEAARRATHENIRTLGLADRALVVGLDAARLGPSPHGRTFDLAFLDPPYGQGLNEAALTALAANDWLSPEAVVVVERGADEPALKSDDFDILDSRAWGAARVTFLRLA